MKQVLTFVSLERKFNDECAILVKLQIDNSLNLGWKPEDIILATNFGYEYRGVKATLVGDSYCDFFAPATKVFAINSLFTRGLIRDGIYWYHDFDTYQFHPISEEELQLDGYDFGLTNYGRMPRLCSASMFFTKNAGDLFWKFEETIENKRIDDERSIMQVLNDDPEARKVTKILNTTYALHRFNLLTVMPTTTQPVRAAHFHPTPDKMDFFMYGHNKLNVPLLPEKLIEVFQSYGYK